MKYNKIGYWTLTIIFAGMMALSSMMYLSHQPPIVQAFLKLGFPLYILNLLGTAKLIGVISLVQTRFSTLKEWAYAGFTINLIAASWIHLAVGESIVMPFVLFIALFGSYYFWKKIRSAAKEVEVNKVGRYAM